MAKVKGVADTDGTRIGYRFNCPGCNEEHVVNVYKPRESNGAIWGFNENVDNPTFTPSINISWGKVLDPNWIAPDVPDVDSHFWSGRCHSFVTNGMIQFLGDCTHQLANQTVPLPDIA